MPFADGQRFGEIHISRIADYPKPADDPQFRASASDAALLPTGPEVRIDLARYDFAYARVAEPRKGRKSDNTTPERVHWVFDGRLVSTTELHVRPGEMDVDLEAGRAIFMCAEGPVEADLKTGLTTKMSVSGWPLPRRTPSAVRYLADDHILMSTSLITVGQRKGNTIGLDSVLELETLGLCSLKQRVFFSSDESSVLFGYDRGAFRILARLDVWAKGAWIASQDKFRFYVDPFQNKALPPSSCGTFELSGALEAWRDGFADGHAKDYPEITLKSVAEV